MKKDCWKMDGKWNEWSVWRRRSGTGGGAWVTLVVEFLRLRLHEDSDFTGGIGICTTPLDSIETSNSGGAEKVLENSIFLFLICFLTKRSDTMWERRELRENSNWLFPQAIKI